MKMVFGLDIGTRSIVGTVGYRSGEKFHVLAQRFLEHDTRAMLEGQIHDIAKVGEGVARVKEMLEKDLGEKLTEVCIAAAGRVLRTVTTSVEIHFDGEKDITQDDVYELSMMGVQKAYEEFHTGEQSEVRFYCVGYTVMRYYINGYQMNNPENHKARILGADMISTFLPDDVVDGLYKAVELAGLQVANLTLEPIAAIQVAIPERYRLLNMALVDVGAGTSDICITREGTITAYGMIPVAGDSLTDRIAQHCLVEFQTAERIKREIGDRESVTFEDIMGIAHTETSESMLEIIRPGVDEMTKQVADVIRELNGEKAVSAVFVVGGGGMIPGYTESLAAHLGLLQERVAIRGKEVMKNIVFDMEDARQDSLMVTPIGICCSYYEQNNNFIFIEFNGVRIKLYDNGRLTVADAAIQSQFPNEDLFPKRGESLTYTVNDRAGMTRGSMGEPSVILVNGEQANLNTCLRNGDRVDVISSAKGDDAVLELGKLPEMRGNIRIRVNGKEISLPRIAEVNGEQQSVYYRVKNGDVITVRDWYTVQDIASSMDLIISGDILVNDAPAKYDTRVYDSFSVSWGKTARTKRAKTGESAPKREPARRERKKPAEETAQGTPAAEQTAKAASPAGRTAKAVSSAEQTAKAASSAGRAVKAASLPEQTAEGASPAAQSQGDGLTEVTVTVNGSPLVMRGKKSYIYVDVFDLIDFDLNRPAGKGIVTKLNGRRAEYFAGLHNGDVIEIYWE